MKHKIAGTKHKDRQQRIATKQGPKKKSKAKRQRRQPGLTNLPTTVSSPPLPTLSGDMASAAPAKSKRSESDPIGARHRKRKLKVADRSKHRKRKRKQAGKHEANEERRSTPPGSFRLHQHASEKPRTKRQRGGTATPDRGLQCPVAEPNQNDQRQQQLAKRSEDLRTKTDGESPVDNR